ncbi:protein LNK3 isoform X2 [Lotus japonicus]|uniref:protein LNK3 isoform X2 n=1 Tax=Lotus japonicus TaxID=34305 RepID=UPI0025879D34|nr:protein LNK3 isoform X2 [Lotus japonicus]
MDCYYGSSVNDFLVLKDEVLLDRYPSPDYWSNWGISATEDQSSSSSACGGLPEQSFQQTTFSCDQPNYQLQDLPRFERMDDIFLETIPEDPPCVEILDKSVNFSPEKRCSNTPGGLQKDIAASKFDSSNSESKDCLDIEPPPVKSLDSHEEFILKDLQMVIGQFTEGTRFGFRDALYRLSGYTEQQQVLQDKDADPNTQKATLHTDDNETVRFQNNKSLESETNSTDRLIAKLMFNNMEFNMNGHQ